MLLYVNVILATIMTATTVVDPLLVYYHYSVSSANGTNFWMKYIIENIDQSYTLSDAISHFQLIVDNFSKLKSSTYMKGLVRHTKLKKEIEKKGCVVA